MENLCDHSVIYRSGKVFHMNRHVVLAFTHVAFTLDVCVLSEST